MNGRRDDEVGDDVTRGRWWTPRMPVAFVVALLFLAGSVGYTIRNWEERPPSRDSADVGFLWDMIAHHEQALEMASLELTNGAERGVQVFAREFAAAQSYEIGLMEAYLQRWGLPPGRPDGPAMAWMGHPIPAEEMPGMATEEQLGRLADSTDRDADALFLALMQRHHAGGVHMAAGAINKAKDSEVVALARRVERNQRIEIRELEGTRRTLGLPVPTGIDPLPALGRINIPGG